MRRPDFSELRKTLVASTRRALGEFAASRHNEQVYAAVFDTMEEYGTVILSLNTVSALRQWREKTYAHYRDDQVTGLFGLKYNSGDFSFIDYGGVAADQREWAQRFEKYLQTLSSDSARQKNIERFTDAIADAIHDLESDYRQLDLTDDFVAYHCFHDADEETIERLVRKTVDESTFDRIFPEISEGRALLARIAELAAEEQAKQWVGCLEAYALGSSSALASEFFRRHTWLDVREHIVAVGAAAVPMLMNLLDDLIYKPQFNEKGSEAYDSDGAFTRYSDIAVELLRIISAIAFVDRDIESRLLEHFRRLQEDAGDGDSVIGVNLRWVAATLHALLPDKYPHTDCSFSGNRVRNSQAYSISG